MLTRHPTYAATRDAFAWDIPVRFNIGSACTAAAERSPDAPAILTHSATTTSADLAALASRYAGVFAALAAPGDRIAVLLPQRAETAAAHLAAFKCGAISLPLFPLFGSDALAYRLRDSGARLLITDAAGAGRLVPLRDQLPDLTIFSVDGPGPGAGDLTAEAHRHPPTFADAATFASDPALLIYTSGTTGPPKGALLPHATLLGHLPGVEMSHDFLPQPGDRLWTPADWAWIGGLIDILLPALFHGLPVVAHRFEKFTGHQAFDLLDHFGVRNAFLPPTALKIMYREAPDRQAALRSVASGGEPLGTTLLDWGRQAFGTTINEFYGQTECNMIVSSAAALAPAEPGAMGWPVPGHRVTILTETGTRAAPGTAGEIAVRTPDPVMFLRYWNNPDATAAKFRDTPHGRYLLTGDIGEELPSGRLRYISRNDDIIASGGYRLGPGEIEDCLLTHPSVSLAGVIGTPDPIRGARVTAFVQLARGHAASDDLAADIQAHVKARLAAHAYPRQIHFIADMPLTATGKIIRAELRRRAAVGAE